MATAAEIRKSTVDVTNRTSPGESLRGERCHRCGGLMVGEFCMDMLSGTAELEFLASRCVQCGEVVDPVILKNRRIQRPSSTYSLFGSVGTTA